MHLEPFPLQPFFECFSHPIVFIVSSTAKKTSEIFISAAFFLKRLGPAIYLSAFIFLNLGNIAGLRRFISMEGPHKFFVIHELTDLEKYRNDEQIAQKKKFGMNISGIYQRIIQSP